MKKIKNTFALLALCSVSALIDTKAAPEGVSGSVARASSGQRAPGMGDQSTKIIQGRKLEGRAPDLKAVPSSHVKSSMGLQSLAGAGSQAHLLSLMQKHPEVTVAAAISLVGLIGAGIWAWKKYATKGGSTERLSGDAGGIDFFDDNDAPNAHSGDHKEKFKNDDYISVDDREKIAKLVIQKVSSDESKDKVIDSINAELEKLLNE